MTTPARPGSPGATRTCPHCRAVILESADVCPSCRHHLRAGGTTVQRTLARAEALRVEGTLVPPADETWEYTMVVTIRDERGEEVAHHVVGVGALRPGEHRHFSVGVELTQPGGTRVRPG
ncbi:MAG TPA: hypothetical protein VFN90_08575 [Gemmatimonadales bacterium]|nr:hypothetical protein [Gemmatimonadales bacterium]